MFVRTGIHNHSARLCFKWFQRVANTSRSSFLADCVSDINRVLAEGYVVTDAGNHDDAMKSKRFPNHWPFVRESTGHRWIPFNGGSVIPAFDVSFMLVRANFWTNTHSRGRWSETSWRSCDITVMPVSGYKPELIHSEAQSTLQQRTASLKSPAGSSAIKCIVSRSRQLTYLFHHNTIKTHWRFPDTDRGLI